MEDSVTYQTILNRGKAEGEQIGLSKGEQIGLSKGEQIGLSKGEQIGQRKGQTRMAHISLVAMLELKFGSVDPAIQAAIQSIQDEQRLTNMIQSVAKIAQARDILQVM